MAGISATDTPIPEFAPLPILVGITGHRTLLPELIPGLERQVNSLFAAIRRQYPHSPVIVLSSLADGADRLCARLALEAGYQVRAPLPMAREEYEQDFDGPSLREFRELLSYIPEVFVVEPIEVPPGEPPLRGFYYRQAGLYIAQRAHLLIALWDGQETLFPEGGGTYETVLFARQEGIGVCHIQTPRTLPPGGTPPGAEPVLDRDERLTALDEFNRDAREHQAELEAAAAGSKPYLVDAETEKSLGGDQTRLMAVHLYADALSVIYRDFKLRTLRLLSLFGLFLVLSFLIYDEMEADLMLFFYAALVIAACLVYTVSTRRDYHGKYITNRALAEALRVQFYWDLGGVGKDAVSAYTYIQKSELDFVRFFFRALEPAARAPGGKAADAALDCIWQCWIRGQSDYHAGSARRKGKQDRRNNSAAKAILIASLSLYIAVAVMELFFKTAAGGALPVPESVRAFLLMHEGQQIIWRGVLKMALGLISAGAAFLANYYGGLSLPKQISDNRRMLTLFGADLPGGRKSLTGEHLRMLGCEAVMESGGWYIAQKENPLSLFIG